MLFREEFDTWVLTTEREALCVVLNCEKTEEERKEGVLKKLCDYLKYDMEYINLFIGNGGFYESAKGMKKSYEEASAIKMMPKPNKDTSAANTMSMMSRRDETQLFNELTEGNIDAALKRISDIAAEVRNDSEKEKKQRYSRVLNVVLRVMGIKKISYEDKMEYEIYNETMAGTSGDVYRKILVLMDMFPQDAERRTSKSESDRIIDYINENYSNTELSRELIAEVFNTQPNYLSTLIKSRLGINFKDYLVNIRIEKAKELLLKDDRNIQDIYKEVGFGSKQTFYRTFKKAVGITPNEFKRDANEMKHKKTDSEKGNG